MNYFQTIGLASDHAGKDLKDALIPLLKTLGLNPVDLGPFTPSDTAVDYPDYASKLARDVSSNKLAGGIAICGTGIGMCITANKFPRVRAVSVWDEYSCQKSREHNDANILCLGGRILTTDKAFSLVKLWLSTPFNGDRHQGRVDKIKEIEKKNFKEEL